MPPQDEIFAKQFYYYKQPDDRYDKQRDDRYYKQRDDRYYDERRRQDVMWEQFEANHRHLEMLDRCYENTLRRNDELLKQLNAENGARRGERWAFKTGHLNLANQKFRDRLLDVAGRNPGSTPGVCI